MTGRVELEIDGGVAVVRFSNPPEGFMDDGTEAGLADALDRIDAAEGLRAVILTGADPGVFIRHYDVRVLEERGRRLAAKGYRFTRGPAGARAAAARLPCAGSRATACPSSPR